MSNQTQNTQPQFTDDKDDSLVGSTNTNIIQMTEYDYKKDYAEGSDKGTAFNEWLSGVDRTMTLAAANESGGDVSWQNYVAPYYLDQIMHMEIKQPDYSATICPNSLLTQRDPATILELEEGTDPNKRPQVQFVSQTGSLDKAMHTYGKKEIGLRRWGWGFSIPNEILSDCTLDLISHRMQIARAQEIRFRTDWLTSELHRYTSDNGTNEDWESTYGNTIQANGTQTTYSDCNGATDDDGNPLTHSHSVAVRDILMALHQFSQPLVSETAAIGRGIKGTNYYTPDMLVLPPVVARDLCLEIFQTGYSQLGPEQLSSQVRQSAFLSNLFMVPIVVCNTSRWVPDETKVPSNFDRDVYDSYIVDTQWLVNLRHRDGAIMRNWINNDREITLWSKRIREQWHVLDPLGVLRIKPCPSGS